MISREPERIDIPHEEGHWFELRKLSWKNLRKARKKQEEEQREIAKAFGAEFLAVLTKGGSDAEDKARRLIRKQQYDVSNYDMETLLFHGVASWSYEEPVTPEALSDLDERTAVWAAQAIIDLTKPPSEEEEKNSLPDSIGRSMKVEKNLLSSG